MGNLLAFRFDDNSEVIGIDKCHVFNNEKDALEFFLSTGRILNMKITVDDCYFSFQTEAWFGTGRVHWAKYHN